MFIYLFNNRKYRTIRWNIVKDRTLLSGETVYFSSLITREDPLCFCLRIYLVWIILLLESFCFSEYLSFLFAWIIISLFRSVGMLNAGDAIGFTDLHKQ